MINAIQFALNGLQGANRKAADAAKDIAEKGTGGDLASDAVNLSQAKIETKANAKVIETVDEMSDDLLRIFDKRV